MATSNVNQIQSVNLSAPTVGALTKFFQDVCAALAAANPETLGIKTYADPFTADVELLTLVQNKQRANSAGLRLTEADRRRDAVISFLFRYFTLMKDSPVDAESEAAARLELLADSYPDLAYVEMTRETTLIDGLLRDLSDASRADDVSALELASYIEALDDAQTAFKSADAARAAEQQSKAELAGGRNSSEMRRLCAEEYKQLVKVTNVFAEVQPSEAMTAFVSEVNAAVVRLKQVIATEKAANTRQTKEG